MYVQRRVLRPAEDLGIGIVWTGPWLDCFMAHQVNLWVKATNANTPAAFAWDASDDMVSILVAATPVATLLQGDAIVGQALNNAGGRKAILISNFAGGVVTGMPWRFVRPKITGNAGAIISGLEVWGAASFLSKPTVVEDDNNLLG